jgi:hypothetical protein
MLVLIAILQTTLTRGADVSYFLLKHSWPSALTCNINMRLTRCVCIYKIDIERIIKISRSSLTKQLIMRGK